MRMLNWLRDNYQWLLIPVILAVTAILVCRCDVLRSSDRCVDRVTGFQVEEAKKERECVPVNVIRLRELIATAREKENKDLGGLGNPRPFEENLMIVEVGSVKLNGKNLLMGDCDSNSWDKYYVEDSYLKFEYKVAGSDTIVYCPAYIFVQLVKIYEKP